MTTNTNTALAEYANPLNWDADANGVRRIWREPGSDTPDAYNGFEMARAALTAAAVPPAPLDAISLMKVVMSADEALERFYVRGTTNWAAAIGKAVQDAVLAAAPKAVPVPVAWRHSKTLCLYDTKAEVPLADGDEWAEPLYLAAPQPVVQQGDDADLARTIDQRDTAEGWADGLAGLIGQYFGQEIGEHSSAHNPWQEARDIIEEALAAHPAAPAAQGDARDQGVREELSIGKAINRAARDLPEGWEIRIDLERHAAVVFLIDPDGNETMSEGGELFSDQINAAIDAARSQAKE